MSCTPDVKPDGADELAARDSGEVTRRMDSTVVEQPSRLVSSPLSETPISSLTTRFHGLPADADLNQELTHWQPSLLDGGRARYRVLGELGRGAQGCVYEVRDSDCGRTVALKVLHERRTESRHLSRFFHEAQVTAQLEHPAIVPVHDVNCLPGGTLFYTMKRIHGQDLATYMATRHGDQQGRFELLQIFDRICGAVAFAHDRGVIHRDLKPRNIMIGDYGEVLVVDWGLAKIMGHSDVVSLRSQAGVSASASDDSERTKLGNAVGTPAFMSPEQAMGLNEQVDPRSDIYALGVILYNMMAGCSPYRRGSGDAVMMQVARGDWTRLDDICSAHEVPPPLVSIIHKAMALEQDDRYQDVATLQRDLQHYLAGLAVSAHAETRLERMARWISFHRTQLRTAAIAVVIMVGLWLLVLGWQSMQRREYLRSLWQQAAAAERDQDHEAAQQIYLLIREYDPDDRQVDRAHLRASQALERHRQRIQEREAINDRMERAGALLAQARDHEAVAETSALTDALDALTQALGLSLGEEEWQQWQHRGLDDLIKASDILEHRDRIAARLQDHERQQAIVRADALIKETDHLVDAGSWNAAHERLAVAEELIPRDERIVALREQIAEGMAQERIAERLATAEALLDRARAHAADERYDDAVAAVTAALAFAQPPAATDLLQEYTLAHERQQERLAQQQRQRAASQLVERIRAAIAEKDVVLARESLAQLRPVSDDYDLLSKMETALAQTERRIDESRADDLLSEAHELGRRAHTIRETVEEQRRRLRIMARRLETDAADASVRHDHDRLQASLDQQQRERSALLAQANAVLQSAHALAPGYPVVRRRLADFYAARVEESVLSGDLVVADASARLGAVFDDEQRYPLHFSGRSQISIEVATTVRLTALDDHDGQDPPSYTVTNAGTIVVPAGRYELRSDDGVVQARRFLPGIAYDIVVPDHPKLPDGMVFIPGGLVIEEDGSRDDVPGFAIGRYEVTIAEWLEFINDGPVQQRIREHIQGFVARRLAEDGSRGLEPIILAPRPHFGADHSLWYPGFDQRGRSLSWYGARSWEFRPLLRGVDQEAGEQWFAADARLPVTGISLLDVRDYLAWRRQRDGIAWRLPTAREWQLAAQGGDGRPYPWGRHANLSRCHSHISAGHGRGRIDRPVGSFPDDRSPQGVYDLAGSVAEMVDHHVEGPFWLLCGGSWTDRDARRFRSDAYRIIDERVPLRNAGFRLALSIDED